MMKILESQWKIPESQCSFRILENTSYFTGYFRKRCSILNHFYLLMAFIYVIENYTEIQSRVVCSSPKKKNLAAGCLVLGDFIFSSQAYYSLFDQKITEAI